MCKANVKSAVNSKRRRLNTPDGESYHSDDEENDHSQLELDRCTRCLLCTCPCLFGFGDIEEEEEGASRSTNAENDADEIDVEDGNTLITSTETIHTPLLEAQYEVF